MRVISTTDLSCEGNDCYIYKSVSLIEEFEMYTVIVCEKVVGWYDSESIYCRSNLTDNLETAKYWYTHEYGGRLTGEES